MNIFRFECRRYFISTLIWALSLTVFGYICIQLFVSFSSDVKFFETMLNAYSPEMLKAFGAQLSTIKTLPGFYSFCFMYIVAAAAFQSTYLGLHVIGKEMSGKSADFIFTKPCTRQKILTCKLASILLCLLLTNLIYSTGSMISASQTGLQFDKDMMWMLNLSMLLTQLLFMALGFLLACVMKKIKTPLALTTGIVSAFFLLQMVVNLEPDGILSYVSFLSYVSADSVVANQGFEIVKLSILVILTIAFLSAGYLFFKRRDIHAL
ncbi:ABC transporter permease subunit [Amedibacillus sp. YH-ame10]